MEQNNLDIMRHSCSHLLASAVLCLYPGTKLAIGPSIEEGFYYDFDFANPINETDLEKISLEMQSLIKENLGFEKKEINLEEARKLFSDQQYKLELIDDLEKEGNQTVSIYTTGDPSTSSGQLFTDLCAGPHIENTSEIGAFKLLSLAGAYWKGTEKNKMLTRIYGTCFPTQKELDDYLNLLEEVKKRDHKKLGPQLGLFMFDETAPGMPYWLPKGTIVYNELLKFWRDEHKKRGYLETITPLLNKKQLYELSGHWEHYKKNMFICETEEKETYCLKPMNCPNAMTIYKSQTRSYRDLPLRFSDCDTLHRNEKSGQLDGLLRVQKFAQDDAHIFVTEDQIKQEYERIFEIAKLFYSIFDIKFRIRLGTNPDDFMGDKEVWKKAENILKEILEKSDFEYYIGEGEGAFYGPKLDIMMQDFGGREWQTGTIQLDFQLPKRFDLKYIDSDGKEKMPVVIHRVIYGSLERFIGILIEHYAGAFPVWLAPVQAIILPITDKQIDYAYKVAESLRNQDIRTEVEIENKPISGKIRDAEMQKIPYMIIVGAREAKANTISVRQRGEKDLGVMDLKDFLAKIKEEIENKL